MDFSWIKNALPRGLYGRAALILIVPIVTLQLVVSAAFLQRHFDDVTQQLTGALANDVNLVVATLAAEGIDRAETQAEALLIEIVRETPVQTDQRAFYDLSGRVVIDILRLQVPGLLAVDLTSNSRRATAVIDTSEGVVGFRVDRRRVSASNPHQLLVLMVLTGILMTGVAYLFLRNQLRPIRRLARVADAFGKGRTQPYKPSGATEVRQAGRAFLDMRNRIEQQIEQRTLMLSGVSHDLRTPITRMKLSLSMLEAQPETEALARDVDEMEALLNTFLDFARADALDDLVMTDPAGMLREIIADATRGGADVALELPEDVPTVDLRPQALRRALDNLIGNALRYGGRARVSLEVREATLRFVVEDDGPGIAIGNREAAIRPFVRLDSARNQDRGSGVGLGLAIAADIARRHGGSLRLGDSADLGGLRAEMVIAR